jgi:hypothetical protein
MKDESEREKRAGSRGEESMGVWGYEVEEE